MGTPDASEVRIAAEQGLQKLVAGNQRFMQGQAKFPTVCKETLADLARGQLTFAAILGCSDSRVPPELIFDANFGELFIFRVGGDGISPEVMGSLQYAGVHLHTPLLVVLGHEGCGAIKAALKARRQGPTERSRIQLLVDGLLPAISQVDPELSEEAQMAQAVEANVRFIMRQVFESPEGQMRQEEGRMKLVGAVYELSTGRVRFLDQAVTPEA